MNGIPSCVGVYASTVLRRIFPALDIRRFMGDIRAVYEGQDHSPRQSLNLNIRFLSYDIGTLYRQV